MRLVEGHSPLALDPAAFMQLFNRFLISENDRTFTMTKLRVIVSIIAKRIGILVPALSMIHEDAANAGHVTRGLSCRRFIMRRQPGFVALAIAGLVAWGAGNARADLIAQYLFDESSGPTLFDSSVNGINGTITAVTFEERDPGSGLGNVGVFNGTTAEVTLGEPDAFDLGADDFTITGWFKMPENMEQGSAFANKPLFQNINYAGGGWVFEIGRADRSYAGEVFFTVGGGSSGVFSQTQAFSDGRVDDDQWHWVAVTNTGGAVVMYIDGLLQVDTGVLIDGTSTATSPPGTITQFGQRGPAQAPYDGLLDDWRIYNESLSATLDGSNYLVSGPLFDVWDAFPHPVEVPGDADGDGDVDLDDFDTLAANYNMVIGGGASVGDFDDDGDVDFDDFVIQAQNMPFGGPDEAVASLPEPTTLAVILVGTALVARRRR